MFDDIDEFQFVKSKKGCLNFQVNPFGTVFFSSVALLLNIYFGDVFKGFVVFDFIFLLLYLYLKIKKGSHI